MMKWRQDNAFILYERRSRGCPVYSAAIRQCIVHSFTVLPPVRWLCAVPMMLAALCSAAPCVLNVIVCLAPPPLKCCAVTPGTLGAQTWQASGAQSPGQAKPSYPVTGHDPGNRVCSCGILYGMHLHLCGYFEAATTCRTHGMDCQSSSRVATNWQR
jgi:hypothetical protein